MTRSARRLGVKALTLYAFSAQNWARPEAEVAGLMGLLRDYLLGEREELMDHDIRLAAVGDLDRLPPHVREPLDELMADTAVGEEMVLTLCLSYGGREELVTAARRLAAEVAAGRLAPDDIDAKVFAGRLWTGDLAEPDLLIRTSGEQRLSNFLLWGSAYAELVFTSTPGPSSGRRTSAAPSGPTSAGIGASASPAASCVAPTASRTPGSWPRTAPSSPCASSVPW